MAGKKKGFAKLLAVWLGFASTISVVAVGFGMVSGGLTIPNAPPLALLWAGWTLVSIGVLGLVTQVIAVAQGILKQIL